MAGKTRKKKGRKSASRSLTWGVFALAGVFVCLLIYSLALRYDLGPGNLADLLPQRGVEGEKYPPAAEETGSGVQPGSSARGSSVPARTSARQVDEDSALSLQILNSTGLRDLALNTGERLRAWDVDVLDRGNAPQWPFPETLLIVRNGRRAAVYELARRLGGVPVMVQRRPDLMLDATLILGHDWEKYNWPD